MHRQNVIVCVALAMLSGCSSGSNGGNPSGPGTPVTTTALAITLADIVLAGNTATATATATLSNGQTQAVTAGFRSDAQSVATVTDSGTVTGVANGEATITVAAGGREATKRIRVAPNYAGSWSGQQRITSCTATGDFIGICEYEGGFIGVNFPIALTARQAGDLTVSGEFTVEGVPFPTFTTAIDAQGAIAFAGSASMDGITDDASWQMHSAEPRRATGTIRERFTIAGLSGDVVYLSDITNFAPSAGAVAGHSRSRLAEIHQALRARRR